MRSHQSNVKRNLRLQTLVAVALAIGACAVHAAVEPVASPITSATGPIRIGFVCPLTGGSQEYGNSARWGAEVAVNEINELGGYMGRPLKLILRDDRADAKEGRKAAEDLVLREKVDFTVGFCNTGVALPSLDLFQDNKHLLMVAATGTAITRKYPAASSYIFRMSAPDNIQAAALVNEIVDRRKAERIAIFADTTGYGEAGLKELQQLLANKGLKPAYVARFPIGVHSLVSEMRDAKAAKAEAVIGYTVGPEFAVMAKSRIEAGFSGLLLGSWPLSFRSVRDGAGSATEGSIMVQTTINDPSLERRMSFLAKLRRHAGSAPIGSLMAAAQHYDAINLLLRALFQTRGDTSSLKLKQALENLQTTYAGVVTTYERPFSSSDHESFSQNMVWLGTWRKGEVQFLYPEDARRSAFIRRKASN